ncbi:YMGG-like glycine zipper-containing protein [Paraburkholderia sp. RL17-337-BIB-A]|uniref:YMGG-like glycine zipper-containing protein n=1 Tax=Paraburkholderia sp. RL17-337-BIB-A TaxID=3031636 RepID=UPI0038B8971E
MGSAACIGASPTFPVCGSLPGTGKTFDQFRADDASCRQFAFNQVGGVSANQAATASAVGSAAIGTGLGAAAGAAFNGGAGAAVGAGVGLLVGSMVGTSAAQGSAYEVQRRYDYAYLQCMYAAGDRVPVRGHMMVAPGGQPYAPPPRGVLPPPPPPAS